jgi:hypothetical protein
MKINVIVFDAKEKEKNKNQWRLNANAIVAKPLNVL